MLPSVIMIHPSLQEIITDSEREDGPNLSAPQLKTEPSMKLDNREDVRDVGDIMFHPLAHCLCRRNASIPIQKQKPLSPTRNPTTTLHHPPNLRV